MQLDIERLIDELTVEEKAALLSGTNFMYTNPIPRLGIEEICMADGPHGLRKQIGTADNGISQSEPATAFPTAAATASSWNPSNLQKMGEAMAEECLAYGVHIDLGPAVNIKRNPRCGRNFEYFSEDPYLTGVMGCALASGIQGKGVGVSVKHFAANNAENFRFMGNSVVDERALREIYLRGFERIVKEVKPYTLMCAYNAINGEFCSENKWLLSKVLREEWGYDGVVMTDWGAAKDRAKGVAAGLDLEMPGDSAYCRKMIIDSVNNGSLQLSELNKAVKNMLNLINKCLQQQKQDGFDKKAHNALAIEIALDSAVLLKNEGLLPLSSGEKLLVVGDLFDKMRYQGAGSSMINSTFLTTPKASFDNSGIKYVFARGYLESENKPLKPLVNEVMAKAGDFDKVVFFGGLTDYAESEGCDRPDIKLPQNQVVLLEKLIEAGKKVVLVLFGGSPVELPFLSNVGAVLNMYLPGQGGGEACKKLLFGEHNPSGKLAESWVNNYSDIPFGEDYSTSINELYKESIFVGYRFYNTVNKKLMFPFGYGLSYTTFEYSDLTIKTDNKSVYANCKIKNIGKVDGAEVVQLYVKNNQSNVFKAKRELRAFSKVFLKAGETKEISMQFLKSDLSYYNTVEGAFVLENGIYEVEIGASIEDLRLKSELEISGQPQAKNPYNQDIVDAYKNINNSISDVVFEQLLGKKLPITPKIKPFHIETRFVDFKKSFMGRFIYNSVIKVAKTQMKKAKRMPNGAEKDNCIKGAVFLKRILDTNSVRTFSMCSGAHLPFNIAEGMVEIANGNIKKGKQKMAEMIVAPPLPKDEKNN